MRGANLIGAVSLLLGAGLLAAPALGHVDDSDALLYRTVARHMVEDSAWFDLRYLPHLYPHFREHLPFGFWPFALAIHIGSEQLLPWVAWLFSVGCLLIVWRTGTKLSGAAGGAVAVLVLATTDSFFRYGARSRLDPELLFFSMAAAAVVLASQLRARDWLLAGALMAIAISVKGPFGAVPFAAAVGARAWLDRSARPFAIGTVVGSLAVVPVAIFLLHDQSWWDGYVKTQLLASAMGERTDGSSSPFFPLIEIAGRFWPGLPLVLSGFVLAFRRDDHAIKLTVLFSALCVAALMIPARKVGLHTLVAFPALALAAGATAAPLVDRLLARSERVAIGFAAIALVSCATAVPLIAKFQPRCAFSGHLAPALASAKPNDPVLLISSPTNWRALAELAGELKLAANPVAALPLDAVPDDARVAVMQESFLPTPLGPWREVSRADGWMVLKR